MNIRDFFWGMIDLWVESNKGSQETQDQCIDLWRAYNRKVIQAPDIFGNPPDIWANYQKNYYEKIPNTPTGVPQLGDVIVWGTNYGKYGHIAVCTEIANTSKFTSFDQNDPIGSSCHFQEHTYAGVLGWLRPKNQLPIQDVTEDHTLEDKVKDLETKIESLNEALASARIEVNQERALKEDAERTIGNLQKNLDTARGERNQAISQKEILEESLKKANVQLEALKDGADVLRAENNDLTEALKASTSLKLSDIGTKELWLELFYRVFHKKL